MGNRLVLHAGDIVQLEGVFRDGTVIIENGAISDILHSSEYRQNETDTVIPCSGFSVCPGFIDLHNQGGGGFSVVDATIESIEGMARAHAAHGTTGLLVTPPVEEPAFRALLPLLAKTVGSSTGGAAILGIHAEGPFINPVRAGCMPLSGIHAPDAGLLDEILECAGGKVAEMTIAPELPGAPELIRTLVRNNIVVSLGHSNATLTDVIRAIDIGSSHVTHFFNAMSPIHHREPGLAGAALYSNDLTVEVIADGFHVHPWILGLTIQNKGVMRTCLATDCMHVMGFKDGEYDSLGLRVSLEKGRVSLADDPGTLAGSVLTMDRAVANMVTMVGVSLPDAVAMASTTPATVLGLEDRKGMIETGYDADITVLDSRYSAVLTLVGGGIVHDSMQHDK